MFKGFCLFLILIYRAAISPLFPQSCRHNVSCSQYTYNAIASFGPILGAYFGLIRLMGCSPFSKKINPQPER